MNLEPLPPDLPPGRIVACLGLISDTHMPKRWPALPAAVFEALRGVDLVLHAGDVGELWVLDELSAIAPVVAVHGNDETDEARRALPYQQVIAVGGRRLFLCHSHFADREAEMASRVGDDWRSKLDRYAAQARQAGATVYVLGHLHIPFFVEHEGVWLVNPGAIASSTFLARQTRQTVARLMLRDDGRPFVVHIDLAQPEQPHVPAIDWRAGFSAAAGQYSTNFAHPRLRQGMAALRASRWRYDKRLNKALAGVGMACRLGQKAEMTVEDAVGCIEEDSAFDESERAELIALFKSDAE